MTSTTLQLSEPYGAVHVADAGQGEALVLLHGVGMQIAAWGPQTEAFQKTHRVIAIDLPGHGGSDPLPDGAALEEFVVWLHEVLSALDLGPVNLAGHSMGALISSGYTISHPQNVRRVALLNCVHNRTAEARRAVEARAVAIAGGHIDYEAPVKRWFRNTPDDQKIAQRVLSWLSDMDIRSYATTYQAFATGDRTYASSWTEVQCPVLALTADGDPNSTPDMSQAIADAAPNAEAIVIKGHRHMVSLTDPQEVNAQLARWLRRETDPEGMY